MPTTHRPEPTSSPSRCMHAPQQHLLIRCRQNSCSPPSRPPRPLAQICSTWFHSHCDCNGNDNDNSNNQYDESQSPSIPAHTHHPQSFPLPRGDDGNGENNVPPIVHLHQPIGFVCCQCSYRSSGSYCSNPDRPDCPHRGCPRCGDCPILFTPPQRPGRGAG
ncbi:hypothetical protein F4775DRAFT_49773 [Biscogniauxia sp. FL1348]|nr:hypothetical protein F4775DRAFT_49773 [Biscogniauxia sp. FL1348]